MNAKIVADLAPHTSAAAIATAALADNTVRAIRADARAWASWAVENGESALPARPDAIARYILSLAADGYAYASIRRALASIASAHRHAGASSPTRAEIVRAALRAAARQTGRRQTQASAATWSVVREALDRLDRETGIAALRDAAMLAVAYDAMTRRAELVALRVEDIEDAADGSGVAHIRRGKTDQGAIGSARYLRPDTLARLRRWLDAAGIRDGAIFRRIRKGGRVCAVALDSAAVALVFKRRCGAGFSGHSTRVGAAQDCVAAGLDLAQVMQAGGWRTQAQVARYAERLTPARGAMAKLAKQQEG